MVLVSFAKKLLMWHEERVLAFQRREKCLLALLLREKGLRYTPHISSLFGDFAVASTFYLPPICSPFFFFIFLFIPFVLLLLNTFLGQSCTAWQATFGSICSTIIPGSIALAKLYCCSLYQQCSTMGKWLWMGTGVQSATKAPLKSVHNTTMYILTVS